MPTNFHESNIDWAFEDGWTVIQYDDTVWYRKHFQSCADSAAVDFVAIDDANKTSWWVEVKDFTVEQPRQSKDAPAGRDAVHPASTGVGAAQAPTPPALTDTYR